MSKNNYHETNVVLNLATMLDYVLKFGLITGHNSNRNCRIKSVFVLRRSMRNCIIQSILFSP
jgi:hypothetical protein